MQIKAFATCAYVMKTLRLFCCQFQIVLLFPKDSFVLLIKVAAFVFHFDIGDLCNKMPCVD